MELLQSCSKPSTSAVSQVAYDLKLDRYFEQKYSAYDLIVLKI